MNMFFGYVFRILSLSLVVLMLAISTSFVYAPHLMMKKAPFEEIYFEEEKCVVQFEGSYYEWVEAEGYSLKELTQKAKTINKQKWQSVLEQDYTHLMKTLGCDLAFKTKVKLKSKAGDMIVRTININCKKIEPSRNHNWAIVKTNANSNKIFL